MNIDALFAIIKKRQADMPEGSYVASLLNDPDRLIQKIGEEATETVIAAKNRDKVRQTEELADLLFHITVLCASLGLTPSDIYRELEKRTGNGAPVIE